MSKFPFRQNGYVLITGLIFILVIAVVTTSSMQSSNLGYKISTNVALKDLAFQGSESGRIAAGVSLRDYVYDLSWPTVTGLTNKESAYKADLDTLGVDENLLDTSSLDVDMAYAIEGEDIENINADVSLVKAPGGINDRSGMQQLSGYEGLGKGAAAGGVQLIWEIRSQGSGAAGARAVTASEYRVIP